MIALVKIGATHGQTLLGRGECAATASTTAERTSKGAACTQLKTFALPAHLELWSAWFSCRRSLITHPIPATTASQAAWYAGQVGGGVGRVSAGEPLSRIVALKRSLESPSYAVICNPMDVAPAD